jgi:uncharacterized protein YdaL
MAIACVHVHAYVHAYGRKPQGSGNELMGQRARTNMTMACVHVRAYVHAYGK